MTTKGQDNPWAFPLAEGAGADGRRGMSLRDYFAAKAMQTVLSDPWYRDGERTYAEIAPMVATEAYTVADAMLEARKEGV